MKGALLAQEYYKLARMVAFYIYDLTKEKMLDPDDYLDGVEGKWKTDIYGEPFNYQSKETRIRILDNYLINRPFQIALIYEGETEDYVIHEIFKVLNIDEDSDGVFLWKAKGQGNIEKNMYGLAELARAIEMRIFLILDRDASWIKIIDEFKRRRYINNDLYCVWNKDFESDNFTVDQIVNVVNTVLEQKNLGKIEKGQVGDRMNISNVGVTKAISDLIWDDKGMKLEDVISKAELARTLIEPRISEIKTERDNGNEWKPLLPIEKELRRIFEMIPRIIG